MNTNVEGDIILQVDQGVPDYIASRVVSESIVSDQNILTMNPVTDPGLWSYSANNTVMNQVGPDELLFKVVSNEGRGYIDINIPTSYIDIDDPSDDDIYMYKIVVKGNLPVTTYLYSRNTHSTVPNQVYWSTYGILFKHQGRQSINTIRMEFSPKHVGDRLSFAKVTLHPVNLKYGGGSGGGGGSIPDDFLDIVFKYTDGRFEDGKEYAEARISVEAGRITSEVKNYTDDEIEESETRIRAYTKTQIEQTDESIRLMAETIRKEIENKVPFTYRTQIYSSNGDKFINGNISTKLYALVFRGPEEITDVLDAGSFTWTRISDDPVSDDQWNQTNFGGKKFITITKDDVHRRATFQCDVNIELVESSLHNYYSSLLLGE